MFKQKLMKKKKTQTYATTTSYCKPIWKNSCIWDIYSTRAHISL